MQYKKIQKDLEKWKEIVGYNSQHVEGRSPETRLSLDPTLTTSSPTSETYSEPARLPVNCVAYHWIYANKLACQQIQSWTNLPASKSYPEQTRLPLDTILNGPILKHIFIRPCSLVN
jgi:hypothetical protein